MEIDINIKEKLITGIITDTEEEILPEFTHTQKVKLDDIPMQKRGGKGIIIYKPSEIYGNVS